jgi:hypothetical protein
MRDERRRAGGDVSVGEVDECHADEDEAEPAEQGAIGPLAEEEQRAEDADGRHAEERE